MQDVFSGKFTIKLDTSYDKSMISAYDPKINDTWQTCRDLFFESGKIYGIVSEYGQGCTFLSYLLGGNAECMKVKIFCNDTPVSRDDLKKNAFDLEPNGELYGKMTVRKSIEKALSLNNIGETFEEISEKFMLTPERSDRRFTALSGERWRASAAYGYALNKRIFFSPYNPSRFYSRMCDSHLLTVLRVLTDKGALVVLPVGSDRFIKQIADEVVYLDQ